MSEHDHDDATVPPPAPLSDGAPAIPPDPPAPLVDCATPRVSDELLPGWRLRGVWERPHPSLPYALRYVWVAVNEEVPASCPSCGAAALIRWGYEKLKGCYADTPIGGHWRGVYFVNPRYRCSLCKRTHTPAIPGVQADTFMTIRLHKFLCHQALHLTTTFAHLHERTGVWVDTIAAVVKKNIAARLAADPPRAPRYLSIDNTHVAGLGSALCVLSDARDRRIIDVLPHSGQGRLAERLATLPDAEGIVAVCLDMDPALRATVRESLPHAPIVADRFHVERLATEALDVAIRRQRASSLKGVQRAWYDAVGALHAGDFTADTDPAQLDARQQGALKLLLGHPDLRASYACREGFRFVYRAPTRAEAEARYAAWVTAIPSVVAADYKKLVRDILRWRSEFFAYFDFRESLGWAPSNGPAEALHRRVRTIYEACHGASFELVRGKAILYPPWQVTGSVRTLGTPPEGPHQRPGRLGEGAAGVLYDDETTEQKGEPRSDE